MSLPVGTPFEGESITTRLENKKTTQDKFHGNVLIDSNSVADNPVGTPAEGENRAVVTRQWAKKDLKDAGTN